MHFRTMQIKQEVKRYLDDYEEWQKEPKKAVKKNDRDISFYEAFDRFRADHDVSENDKEIFYGSVFRSLVNSGRGKEKLFQRRKQKLSDRKK